MSLVSVIIPSFNRKEMTQRAVASVRKQIYRDFEIIVVDDCSRAGEIYEPEPGVEIEIRVVRHEVNRGAAAARNTGVQAARGEMIAFLDSDDVWYADRLEKQMAFFLRQPDPDNILICSNYYWKENDSHYKFPLKPYRPGMDMSDYVIIDQGCLHIDTWLARKSIIERVPLNEQLRWGEDWDALMRMEREGIRFAFCPVLASVRYVGHGDNHLSTLRDVQSRRRFLEMNEAIMTPGARLLYESHLVNYENVHTGRWQRYLSKLRTFALESRMSFPAKCRLVWIYIFSRLEYRIRRRLARRPNGQLIVP